MATTRRSILIGATATAAGLTLASTTRGQSPTEPQRPAPLDRDLVFRFIRAAHTDLDAVKQMLDTEPGLLHASWNWGAGDWETALGAAGHMANRSIAEHLLERGGRLEPTAAAMLGMTPMIIAMIDASPAAANALGPHGYTLLYHAARSGEIGMAAVIAEHVTDRPRHFNQALMGAVQSKRTDMAAWLLDNGVTDPNTRDFMGRTPLKLATDAGMTDIAEALREAGGVIPD